MSEIEKNIGKLLQPSLSEVLEDIQQMNRELSALVTKYAAKHSIEFDIHIYNDALKPAQYNPVTMITSINGVKLGKAKPNPA